MNVLIVRDWEKHFETAKSMQIGRKSQAEIPVKQGLGRARMLAVDPIRGPAMYGAYVSIICFLSSRTRDVRNGYLTENGEIDGPPMSVEDIAIVIGMDKGLVSDTVNFAASLNDPWIRVCESKYLPSTQQVPDVTGKVPYVVQECSVQECSVQESTAPKVGAKKKRKRIKYPDEFKTLWTASWPRLNGDKQDALKAWLEVPEDERADVQKGVEIVRPTMDALPEDKRPHLATWIRGARWEAAIDFGPNGTNGNGKAAKESEAAIFADPKRRADWIAAGMDIPDEYLDADERES